MSYLTTQDYCNEEHLQEPGWAESIKQCIAAKKGGLAKRLGGQRVTDAIAHADAGEWDLVCSMMLDYYDKLCVCAGLSLKMHAVGLLVSR